MDERYYLRNEGVLIVDRGAWQSGEDYEVGDLSQNSGSFICILDHTAASGNEPGVGASWQTYWKALQVVTGTYSSTYFKAQDTVPYYRLVDGSNNDVVMKLDGGVWKLYDQLNTALMMSIDTSGLAAVLSGALAVGGALTVATEKTDHHLGQDIARGIGTVGTSGALGGTWTVSEGAADNIQIVTRTAAQADHYYRMPVLGLPKRSTASKGAKLISATISYVLGGTIDTTNDILALHIIKQSVPADGSVATASILAGDSDDDYDASHNTNALRLAAGSHTITVTIPEGERAYAALGEQYAVRVRIKDASTANLTFVLTGCYVTYAAAEY